MNWARFLHALSQGGDNAEGVEIPSFMIRTFALLPTTTSGLTIPNYIQSFLAGTQIRDRQARPCQSSLDTFVHLWRTALAVEGEGGRGEGRGASVEGRHSGPSTLDPRPLDFRPLTNRRLTVLEPACGSANDYRFLEACGLAPLIDYHGVEPLPRQRQECPRPVPRH